MPTGSGLPLKQPKANLQKEGRHILLLIDNAPGHVVDEEERALSNVKVEFLPPNTTSKIQPMDAGIIAAFKRHSKIPPPERY